MNNEIGFIGLGNLGQVIAANLCQDGYKLKVYNRTAEKAQALVALGAEVMTRPAEVSTKGGIVVTVLWDDASVESIVNSEGFLEQLGPGGVHLSMTTISPAAARKLAALHAQNGSYYVEAPVFGRPEAAAARQLWICLAGPAEAKARVQPLLEALSQGIFDFGENIGAAVITKLCGNFLIVSAARSMYEAINLAAQNGADPVQVVDMLTQTLFSAPIYQSYGKRIASGERAFPLQSRIPQKDVGLFREAALQTTLQTPIANFLSDLLSSQEQ